MSSSEWLDRNAYPFPSRFVELDVGRMHVLDTSLESAREDLPVILFVHGTPSWSFEFRHLVERLRGRYRCVAPDHLGFGLSERPRDFAYTPEAHAKNLRALVAKLGLRRFTLVVHDFGGAIGLPLALEGELELEVERVIFLNTWMWPIADDPAMARSARLAGSWLGRLLYRWLDFSLRVIMPAAYAVRARLTPEIHAQYLAPFARDRDARVRVLWALARSLLASSRHFASLWTRRGLLATKGALIVWGMKDRALPPAVLDRLATALPHARVVRVADAGHWPHEEKPAEVLDAIESFLDRAPSASAAAWAASGELRAVHTQSAVLGADTQL